MATEYNSEFQDKNEENKPASRTLIVILALLLVGSIGFNVYQYSKVSSTEAQLNETVVSSQDLKTEMNAELDSIRRQMEQYRGQNAEMDELLAQKEKDLIERASRIEQLLKDNKITYNKYLSAKKDLEKFRFYADKYLAEVKALSEENKRLASENGELQETVKTKDKQIDKMTDELVLKRNKLEVAEKLMIDPNNINVEGIRMKGSKERSTERAKNIDKIKVCFQLPKNLAAESGTKTIYIQILDPKGQTVTTTQTGGGTIDVEGRSAQYTTSSKIEYDNEKQANQCVYWGNPDHTYVEGRYTIVLYTDGYKMGEKNFQVK